MTTWAVVVATALVVSGAVAVAGTVVTRGRGVAAVAAGALVLLVADGRALTAGTTVQHLGTAAVPLTLAMAAMIVLGWRPATAAALAGAVVAGPVRQLFEDPFHDPGCTGQCDVNPLAVLPDPVVADLALVVGGVLLLAALLVPLRSPGARTLVTASLGALGGWSLVSGSAAGAAGTAAVSEVDGAVGALAAAGAATAGVVVLTVDLVRSTSRSARWGNAVAVLASAQDPERVLARALGGVPVAVGYPVEGGQVVDLAGRPLPPAGPGATVVRVSGPDGPVAEVRGEQLGLAPVALARALRGPARLALENNRLAAEGAVRLAELRASAGRLVVLAEQSRRRVERDLHDGAQRHVLTLGLAIRTDPSLPEQVRAEAADTVRSVLDQLRDVAHGVSPPALGTGGLAHALAGLADRSPVPLRSAELPGVVDDDVAHAAYRLVVETLRTATGPVEVLLSRTDDGWRLVVVADSGGGLAPSSSDRFRAHGGSLRSEPLGAGWRHEGHLPPRLR